MPIGAYCMSTDEHREPYDREAHVRIWERVGVRFPCATRHIITDTNGLLVGAQVHGADIQDRDGAVGVLASIRYLFP